MLSSDLLLHVVCTVYLSLYLLLSVSVSGRFDEAVIEERRKAAEAMLLFTTSIPALYNSPQLKDFFRVGYTHTHTYRKWNWDVTVTNICTEEHASLRGVRLLKFFLLYLCPFFLFHTPPLFSFHPLFLLLSGWRGHKTSRSYSVLCRASASPSHPPSQTESLRLWACRGGGGKGGSYLTPGPGHQPGLRSGGTWGGGWGLQRDGRLPDRRR